jgi:hypothetical protein
MELALADLEADASEDDLAAEAAASKATSVTAFERKRPVRKPFPEHLPRERVVPPAPCACPACGGTRLSKLGEDVTETLEVIPRSWKVIQTIREKVSCRDCEAIPSRRHRSTSCRGDGRGRVSSPCCCSRSTASTIQTARLNDVDPQAWLADVLARIANHPIRSLDGLLPWNWRNQPDAIAA